MNNKKSIIIILILFILLFSGYFLIKNNDTTTKDISDNNLSKNMSMNKINNSSNISNDSNYINNSSNIIDNSNNIDNLDSSSRKHNNQQAKKSKVKSDEITEEDILEIVKNGVWWDDGKGHSTQNVKLGKPYKVKDGFWLVGAFDKKTGKFLGAVWVGFDGGGFTSGPDSYSEYKDIISGKSIHKSKSNKNDVGGKSAPVEDKIPDFSERYVLSTSNPNVSNGSDILITEYGDVNLDNEIFPNLNQLMPVIESDCELNSTS